jgi:hypothetical protein
MVIDGSPTGLRALVLVDGTEAYPRGGTQCGKALGLTAREPREMADRPYGPVPLLIHFNARCAAKLRSGD